jgi:hypothetical protein
MRLGPRDRFVLTLLTGSVLWMAGSPWPLPLMLWAYAWRRRF